MEKVTSESYEQQGTGVANIQVEFARDTDMDFAALDVRAASEMVRLHAGGLVTLTSSGVLPASATWPELRGFVQAMAIDPLSA